MRIKDIMKYSIKNPVRDIAWFILVSSAIVLLGEGAFAIFDPDIYGSVMPLTQILVVMFSFFAGVTVCGNIMSVSSANGISRKTSIISILLTNLMLACASAVSSLLFERLSIVMIDALCGKHLNATAVFAKYISYPNAFAGMLASLGFYIFYSFVLMSVLTMLCALMYRLGKLAFIICYMLLFTAVSYLPENFIFVPLNTSLQPKVSFSVYAAVAAAAVSGICLLLRRLPAERLIFRKSYNN